VKTVLKALCLICSLLLATAAYASGQDYQVVKKLKLGGEGGWDYPTVDNAARRLYLSRATHVVVVDIDTNKVVGDVPGTSGVHGIAVAPELSLGFTSNGRSNTSTMFDLRTLEVLALVNTGETPDAILYDPATRRVFTFNARGKDATVFDAPSGDVVGTIPLGGKPEFAATNAKGRIYVNIEDRNEVVEIDSAKLQVLNRYPLKPCENPTGMALDADHGRVFSGCRNKIMTILDTRAGKVIATVPIGKGVDGVGFDPGTELIFSSNGEGSLTVVKESGPGHFDVVETVSTQVGARTMAIDTKTHNIYLPTASFVAPPESAGAGTRIRPEIVKGSFVVLIVGR
jgi:DNA-binding beta-propeller fold protein YncE